MKSLLDSNNDGEKDWNEKGIVHVKNIDSTFKFLNVKQKPVLSINRDFSAPVIIDDDQSFDEKLILLKHDKNSFNRFETAQNLAIKVALDLIKLDENGDSLIVPDDYLEAFGEVWMTFGYRD